VLTHLISARYILGARRLSDACLRLRIPVVVIPASTQHYVLQRNLLYTGVTRGKRLVVLVGQKRAVAFAVRNVRAEA
jgi:UvrD-like helicase C-terminal domain